MSDSGAALGARIGMAVPVGPVDRVSFHDEQVRRRRGTWRLSLACLGIAAAMGFVTSAIAGPAILLLGGGLLDLAGSLGLPVGEGSAAIGRFAAERLALLDEVLAGLEHAAGPAEALAVLPRFAAFLPAFLPGLLASALLWMGFRRLLRRDRAEELIEVLKARPPRPGDLEERQLGNIVEEMAIAAGLPVPRLLMVDAPAPNAAVVGSSHADATILVTRGLLDRMDRDETAAIMAHLIASVGNGDLGVMRSLYAVFLVKGFFLTLFDLPLRLSAWTALGRLASVLLWRRSSAAVEAAARGIEEALSAESTEAITRTLSGGRFGQVRAVLLFPLVLLMLVAVMQKFILQIWTLFFLGWPLAALWRTRRFLADSTAVQLTRNPEALGRALVRLAETGAVPAGAEARDYLFVHAPHGKGGFASQRGIADAIQPTMQARTDRILAQGAGLRRRGWRPTPGALAVYGGLTLVLSPLFAVLLVLVGLLTAGTVLVSLALGLTIVAALLTEG